MTAREHARYISAWMRFYRLWRDAAVANRMARAALRYWRGQAG